MPDWISNVPLIGGIVSLGGRQTATAWNLWLQAGVQGSS